MAVHWPGEGVGEGVGTGECAGAGEGAVVASSG